MQRNLATHLTQTIQKDSTFPTNSEMLIDPLYTLDTGSYSSQLHLLNFGIAWSIYKRSLFV
jgi:hypothetical protein